MDFEAISNASWSVLENKLFNASGIVQHSFDNFLSCVASLISFDIWVYKIVFSLSLSRNSAWGEIIFLAFFITRIIL